MTRNIFLIILMGLLSWNAAAQLTGNLDLTVENINDPDGILSIGLFTEDDEFLEIPSYSNDIPVEGKSSISVSFEDIPYGTYAFSVFHDIDGNGELDTNFMGIPKEPVGFSNEHEPRMGPPRFRGAAFELDKEKISMKIRLYTY